MKKILTLLLAVLMTLSFCACGSSNRSSAVAPAAQYTAAYDVAAEAAMADEVFWEPSEYSEYDDSGFSAANSTTASGGASEAPEGDPEKIIYSADVTVETTDFDESLARLDELIRQYGGWVESSSVNGANFYNQSRGYRSSRSADYTLRIPSDRFNDLMTGLSDLGNIPYTHTYTENVTAQYYDVQAHLNAYQTQEARLLEMMEVAETVEDIVTLEDRLTELRYRIESLQSQLNNWDRRVSYSSVYLSVQEVWEYTPEPETKISYGRELWLALLDGIRGVGDFFSDLLILLVGLLPALLILGVLAAILVPLVKKGRSRRRAKKAAKTAEKETVLERAEKESEKE